MKDRLAPDFGVGSYQLKLIHETTTLGDQKSLAACGLTVGAELSVIIMPPIPAWAEGLGLTGEHPLLLCDYYEKHSLTMQDDWASDEGVWEALANARKKVAESKVTLKGFESDVLIKINGEASLLMRAAPGAKVTFEVAGDIWNNNGDSCIHQLLLVLDKDIIAELSDGVPGRGRKLKGTHSFRAPSEPGTYMLWRKTELQYNMGNARRNVEASIGGRVLSKYAGPFVAWLVVE